MARMYFSGGMEIPIGSATIWKDIDPDQQDGYVFQLMEVDLIVKGSSDTANTHHDVWLSVLESGRMIYNPFQDGFEPDILGTDGIVKASDPYIVMQLERGGRQGYLVDNAYFADRVRLGMSTPNNVAGGTAYLGYRLGIDRVKATQAIFEEMYRRSHS